MTTPAADLTSRSVSRRQALLVLGGLGVVAAGCSSGDGGSAAPATTKGASATSTTSGTSATTTTVAPAAAITSCSTIPEETAGPFPGDGSNGPDILAQAGVVRRDITSSFGSASGIAGGVPLTFSFTVVDTASGCKPMAGAAVYTWHCDRDGNYSMYSSAAVDQNYLRGVQEVDANGVATFTSIFPGAYAGRWPHIHFEVYPSVAAATNGGSKLATSQIALPKNACDAVYATAGYEASVGNFASTSLARDNVFSDGASSETPSITGGVASGFVSSLVVGA
jgi:protocatechuate 3,4-dioxygenase beta subunit